MSTPLAASPPQPKTAEIPVRVDERVELLSVLFRLAGAREYHLTADTVPYAKAVDEHFGPFAEHEAVKMAQRLRAQRGIGYDAVAWFALHLKGGPKLEPKVPFDRVPDMEKRWTPAVAAEFLAAVQKFADDTKAFDFFRRHQDLYAKAAERLAAEVAKRPYRAWLDAFFGARPGADFCAIVGLLNGGSSYGSKVRYPDGREEISPILGAGNQFDASGLPAFGPGSSGLVAHEFCHAYCNPLVDRFADRLLPAGEKIFPRRAELMRPQAYGNARTMLYEAMVRACTHRFLVKYGTPREAEAQLRDEVGRGFFWTPELSKLLGEFEQARDQYPTLEAFMPRVIEFFNALAADLDQRMAALPRVKQMTPANGATDVDPALAELRIEFDRAMNPGGYSVVGRPEDAPRSTARGRFSDDGKTFILPVKLEPVKTYKFSLNGLGRSGFTSKDGLPLDPVAVTFTTAKR
jgi:hypothetical protein